MREEARGVLKIKKVASRLESRDRRNPRGGPKGEVGGGEIGSMYIWR